MKRKESELLQNVDLFLGYKIPAAVFTVSSVYRFCNEILLPVIKISEIYDDAVKRECFQRRSMDIH